MVCRAQSLHYVYFHQMNGILRKWDFMRFYGKLTFANFVCFSQKWGSCSEYFERTSLNTPPPRPHAPQGVGWVGFVRRPGFVPRSSGTRRLDADWDRG